MKTKIKALMGPLMKILMVIGTVLLYILLFRIYTVVSMLLDFKSNIILISIISLILFIIVLIQGIKLFKSLKQNYKEVNLTTFMLNLLLLFIAVGSIAALKDIYKVEDKSIALYATILKSEGESEEYNSNFKILDYKNNKIFYTEKQESVMDLIKEYIDEGEKETKDIFGEFETSTLSIKLDYDKEIFNARSNNDKAGGYYLVHANSMYISVEDPFDDVLMGYDIQNNFDFKKTFLHEYAHHVVYEFMEKNNIAMNKVPMWFTEGISEYVGSKGNTLHDLNKIISFDKLNSENDWKESLEKAPIYEQSNYAVSKIIIENGKDVIKDILLNIKEMDFKEAFNKATGTSFEQFEDEFRKDYKNNWEEYNSLKKPKEDSIDNTKTKMKCYEKYLEKNENNIQAYDILSNFYKYHLNDYDKSIEVLKEGIEKNPDSDKLWRYLAVTYEDIGKADLAREAYNKSEELK